MEFPICTSNYSNEYDASEVQFIRDVQEFFDNYRHCYVPFFAGTCYACRDIEVPDSEKVLQRCGGCQLVSYCNKACQKNIWQIHKVVCKEFPVVNGKNVLHTTGSWKMHIIGLRMRIANFPDHAGNAARLFRNPRVCHTCRKARPDHLFNCTKCLSICYCSKQCAKADKSHREHCRSLLNMIFLQGAMLRDPPLPSLRVDSVCDKFTMLDCEWSDILPSNVFKFFGDSTFDYGLVIERLAYPMSLLYALQMIPERRLGSMHCPLEDLTSLVVHVINNSPVFDSESWEFFMHRLPKLDQLTVVYIMQGKPFKQISINLNILSKVSLLRCDDCKVKDRFIEYSVQQKKYHMYFSSEEYIEPDVVVIFGNAYEMSAENDEVDVHSEISYGNITHSQYTLLVLMDSTLELVRQGVKAVNAARPVDQLVLPTRNPLRGSGSDRSDIDSNTAVINDKHYFTCLRSK